MRRLLASPPALEAGILLGAAAMLTHRLWLSIGFHMAWNDTHSAIFSGIVSGNDAGHGAPARPGRAAGLEAQRLNHLMQAANQNRRGRWVPPIGAAAWALAVLASGAQAQDLARDCQRSRMAALVPADQVEQSAERHHAQLLDDARSKRGLASASHAQVVRLRYILGRLVPFAEGCNDRSKGWTWQIHLVGSQQPQYWALPGGRLLVSVGMLSALQLDDDELAALVAHAMAESLLELLRERAAMQAATGTGLERLAAMAGHGASSPLPGMGSTLLGLQQARQQQLRAARVGMVLAAHAGYPPQAALSLWQKLRPTQASKPATLDPSPSLPALQAELGGLLTAVVPVYQQAARPDRRFSPPPPPTTPAQPVTSATE